MIPGLNRCIYPFRARDFSSSTKANPRCEFLFSFHFFIEWRLTQSGNQTGGDFRKVYSDNSTFKDNLAAGTAFVVIRKSDAKGLQLSKSCDHAMIATDSMGMRGWVWTSLGVRSRAHNLL